MRNPAHRVFTLVMPLWLGAGCLGGAASVASAARGPAVPPSVPSIDDTLEVLRPADVFELEYASDPQVSPDGKSVVYVRNFMDVMKDRRCSNLWIVSVKGGGHRPLTSDACSDSAPRWSPDGSKLAFRSNREGSAQLYVRWMDSGQVAQLTHLTESPSAPVWSSDGRSLAFSKRVPAPSAGLKSMPPKPEGAIWAEPAVVVDSLLYRADGQGYLKSGLHHLFVLPAEGGTPRQVTRGEFQHRDPPVYAGTDALVFSSNRGEDWEYDPVESEVFITDLVGGATRPLTDRKGPDGSPVVSPDGRSIAFLGFDDRQQGYQVRRLHVMRLDGSDNRVLTADLDRSVQSPEWSDDSSRIYFQYDDKGSTHVAWVPAAGGEIEVLLEDLGGTSLGRPYSGGSFSVSKGVVAYTMSRPDRPSDVAVVDASGARRQLTRLNDDLLGHKTLGPVEEIWVKSSFDGRDVQAWFVRPPGFFVGRKYPMVLEIHGGPFANYGNRFAAEVQLYAAAGYAVLYVNPRGSTSYGEEFGNLIHHNYPSEDYDDLMSCVDHVIDAGLVDPEQLYVTGGSGGGVLSSWIVGKTARFRAAVVAKPVINWTSFVLTADNYNFYYKYWFPGFPWDHPEHYFARSPLSLVGNVTTPTMLLTGESDYRTPISESEQYYQALKLRKVDAELVRIPGASHGIAARPSNLIAKVLHVLDWFERH